MQVVVRGLPAVIAESVIASPFAANDSVTLCWHFPSKNLNWTSNASPAQPPENYSKYPGNMVFVLKEGRWERYA